MSSVAINSLVFDVGGVLLDWDPEYLYEELIPNDVERDAFLFNVCTYEWHGQTDAGVPFAQIIEEKKAEHPGKFDTLIEAWWEKWDDMCGGIFEGTFDIANMVRAQNPEIKVYGITNFSAETWPRLLNLYPVFGQFFNDVIVSGEEKMVKPDAEIYRRAISRFGIDPKRSVFIDDRSANVKAAEEQGFIGHTFDSSQELGTFLVEKGLLAAP